MSYCAAIRGNAGVGEISRIETAQIKAARIVLRCPRDISIVEQHRVLAWSPVKDIIAISVLHFFYNLQAQKRPKYLQGRFQQVKERHLHSTRAANTDDYVLPGTRLVPGERMFSHRAVKLWDSLPRTIRSLP